MLVLHTYLKAVLAVYEVQPNVNVPNVLYLET